MIGVLNNAVPAIMVNKEMIFGTYYTERKMLFQAKVDMH